MENQDATWRLVDMALGLPEARTVFLYGPPGTGKTYAAQRTGLAPQQKVWSVTLTEETSAAELRGHFILKGQDTVWHDGPVARAMVSGGRLVLNEITHAAGDVLDLLYPILDAPETAEIALPSGATLTPAPGFRVIATDNQGPEFLPEALRDRFNVTLNVTVPAPGAWEALGALGTLAQSSDAAKELTYRAWQSIGAFRARGLEWSDACALVCGEARGPMLADAITLAVALQQAEAKGNEA